MVMEQINVVDAATNGEYLEGVAVGAGAVIAVAAIAFIIVC